ncbi:hypothetical protein ABZ801_27055 [Actinomadura sp. NPDC047616]|uniref:hypothetical protein n=1 Tax=Actinomadura sp. NPDC047616 TaxID=3155914 RepID=UPI0033DCC073
MNLNTVYLDGSPSGASNTLCSISPVRGRALLSGEVTTGMGTRDRPSRRAIIHQDRTMTGMRKETEETR